MVGELWQPSFMRARLGVSAAAARFEVRPVAAPTALVVERN